MAKEIQSYQILDIVNRFHDITERHGDGEISLADAKKALTELKAQAKAMGVDNLPDIDAVLSARVNELAQFHLDFQSIVDRFSEGLLDDKKALAAITALELRAKEQNIPLIGGLELVKTLAQKMKKERETSREEWDDYAEYSEESSSEEEY
jgi:hypothetical protein